MQSLSKFISKLCGLRFGDETAAETVGGNRIRLFDLITQLFPEAVVQVWLAERRRKKIHLVLAYMHPKERVPGHTNLYANSYEACDSDASETFFQQNREAMTTQARRVFGKIGFQANALYHCAINKVLSVSNNETQPNLMPNVLGWAVIGFPSARKLTHDEHSAISLIRTQLAMLLEQSRFRRILELSKQCEQVLRNLPEEEVENKIISLLAEACGARSRKRYRVFGRSLIKIRSGNPVSSNKNGDPVFAEWLTSTFKIIPFCRRYLLSTPQRGDGDGPHPPRSILAIPIALRGRALTSHDFRPLSMEPPADEWMKVVVAYIFLCDKDSPYYLGGWFSETDLHMASSVAHQIEDFLRGRAFEKQYIYISEFFASLPANSELSLQDCKQHLISGLPVVSDIKIVESARVEDKDTWLIDGKDSAAALPLIIAEKFARHATSLRETEASGTNQLISISAVLEDSGRVHLLFHLPTNFVIQRYAVLSLETNLVDQVSLEIIAHFVKELHMYFRAQDAIKERGSMLAQIRHAVVAPLSAAVLNLNVFEAEFERAMKTGSGWADLQNDEEFRDLVPAAISLANQSLLIAQTGRYLLAPITYKDLKIRHYHIVDLTNEIKKAFVWQLLERKVTFRLSVTGTYQGVMTGDEAMLWVIISNLLDNAIKFAYMRTEISVTINLRADRYLFQVQDHGVYLSQSERAKIFQPYSRGSQEGLVHRPGTGLGLPVADMLLRAHSDVAKLDFRSERVADRARTTFFFEMPYHIGASRG